MQFSAMVRKPIFFRGGGGLLSGLSLSFFYLNEVEAEKMLFHSIKILQNFWLTQEWVLVSFIYY